MDRSFTTANSGLLKRTKMNETDIEEDRISKLPDSLIVVQILSRLPDTKYAIRTGVLSKRWQYVWQSVPCLLFDDFSFSKSATHALGDFDFHDLPFIEFYIAVDNALAKFQLGNLNKFELYANYDNRFYSYVKNWIEFAFTRNVKQFKIYLRFVDYDEQCSIESESFYVNSHFTHIDIGFCILHPTVRVRWDNVTTLSISNSRLDEDLISNILSGSPLLKTLTFQSCHGSYINICSDSVKDLVLVGYEAEEHGNVVEINAPNISSFRIIGELWISSIVLVDVSSLVKAELNYEVPRYYSSVRKRDEEELLNGLMFKLQHVKEIKVGVCCFKTLSRLEAKGLYFPSKIVGVDIEAGIVEVESGDSE